MKILIQIVLVSCVLQSVIGEEDCARHWGECSTWDGQRVTNKCINESERCDGVPDCSILREDEENCETCKEFSSMCEDKNKCVHQDNICDGFFQCIDNSDEWNCLTSCPVNQHLCNDGSKCVAKSLVCDGYKECHDNSDEWNCLTMCLDDKFLCHDGSVCIERTHVCNGWSQCHDNSDEFNCTVCGIRALMCGCLSNQTTCQPTGRCIDKQLLLDGWVDCEDGDDEPCAHWQVDAQHSWRCVNKSKKNILLSYKPDSNCSEVIIPCSDSLDERCYTGEWFCSQTNLEEFYQLDDGSYGLTYDRCLTPKSGFGFKCLEKKEVARLTKTCILPQINLYDDIAHCGDGSDLCFDEGKFKCFVCLDKRLVISERQVCDGIVDCYDLSDECLCGDQTLCQVILGDAKYTCPHNHIHCHSDSDCVAIEEALCNEEAFCAGESNIPCSSSQKENSPTEQCPSYGRASSLGTFAHKCDGRPECDSLTDECDGCEDRPPFCDDLCSLTKAFLKLNCRGLLDPSTGKSVCNETTRNLCPKRHNCPNNEKYTSIDVEMVCDGTVDCDDQSDELESICKTRFFCDNKQPLSVDISLVEDGLKQCSDGSDECPTVSKYSTVFSNVREMIANPIFRAVFWIMGVSAGFGNLTVFLSTLKEMLANKEASVIKSMNNLFIINLSFADFLMGLYLLGIAAKSAQLSGIYCTNDTVWRSSVSCNIFGFLVILASTASALTMAIMTGYRLYTVCNPFVSREVNLKRVYFYCMSIWVVSVLLGAIPLFDYQSGYFVSHVWFSNLFFQTDRVPRNDALQLAKRISKENISDFSWYDAKQLIEATFPQFPIKGEFGYYGETSVCMPRLFASVNEASWQYSIFLISLNCLLFIFMLVSYVIIYHKSNKMSKAKKKQVNTKMQRRISRLLITDFCCWIPLCLCGFLATAGVSLSKEVYIVAAGILLPINSAMNPFLYSNMFDMLYMSYKTFVRTRLSDKTTGAETSEIRSA